MNAWKILNSEIKESKKANIQPTFLLFSDQQPALPNQNSNTLFTNTLSQNTIDISKEKNVKEFKDVTKEKSIENKNNKELTLRKYKII